jgi:hypothetical protein
MRWDIPTRSMGAGEAQRIEPARGRTPIDPAELWRLDIHPKVVSCVELLSDSL